MTKPYSKRILQIIPAPVGLRKDGEPVICLALVEEWVPRGGSAEGDCPPEKGQPTERSVEAIADLGGYLDIADSIKLQEDRQHLQDFTWNPELLPDLPAQKK